jgi:hypothetical protein
MTNKQLQRAKELEELGKRTKETINVLQNMVDDTSEQNWKYFPLLLTRNQHPTAHLHDIMSVKDQKEIIKLTIFKLQDNLKEIEDEFKNL